MPTPFKALMAQTYTEWRTKEFVGGGAYEVVDYTDGGATRTVLFRAVGNDASGRAHNWLCDHPKKEVTIHPPQQGPWRKTEPYRHDSNWTGD